MISCYGGASEAMSARIGSAWKKFSEFSSVLFGKQGLSLMQQGKIYQCCVRPAFLYRCEAWKLTVADEARLHGVECCMIRMMCEVRLVDRVSTDVLRDRAGVFLQVSLRYSYIGCTFPQCLCDFLLVTYLVLLDNCL